MGWGKIFPHLLLLLWEKPIASLRHAVTDCVGFLMDLGFTRCSDVWAGQLILHTSPAVTHHKPFSSIESLKLQILPGGNHPDAGP